MERAADARRVLQSKLDIVLHLGEEDLRPLIEQVDRLHVSRFSARDAVVLAQIVPFALMNDEPTVGARKRGCQLELQLLRLLFLVFIFLCGEMGKEEEGKGGGGGRQLLRKLED